MKTAVLALSLLIFNFAYAHGDHDHDDDGDEHEESREAELSQSTMSKVELVRAYTAINQSYIDNIKPIFKRSCFDCHSKDTHYPWYYKIPGVKQLIDSDISEAREHLDFSDGFPFKGHGKPTEDLQSIWKEVSKDEMPLFLYKLMHSETRLKNAEKEEIHKWVEQSLQLLEAEAKEEGPHD